MDGRNLGIRQQNGAAFFLQRFGLLAHGGGFGNAASMRFALEHQNPLLAAPVLAGSSGVYPAQAFSLLQGEHPDVLLWALKPHDDGIAHGLVARWWNLTEAPAATRVRLTGALAGAVAATLVETDVEGRAAMPLSADGSLEVRFTRQQLRTVRLLPLAPGAPAARLGAASGR